MHNTFVRAAVRVKVQGGSQQPGYDTELAQRPPQTKGRKKNTNFFKINFLAPTQNPPFWAHRKKLMCLISWERTQKKGTHINFFGGIFGVKNGVPNGPFSATKSLVYCFFLPLQHFSRIFWGSLRMIFSAVDTQTGVLVSTAKVWISTGYLNLCFCSWFSGYTPGRFCFST